MEKISRLKAGLGQDIDLQSRLADIMGREIFDNDMQQRHEAKSE